MIIIVQQLTIQKNDQAFTK